MTQKSLGLGHLLNHYQPPCHGFLVDGGDLLGYGGDHLSDGGDLLVNGGDQQTPKEWESEKCDGSTYLPNDLLTWVGARDAYASKNIRTCAKVEQLKSNQNLHFD